MTAELLYVHDDPPKTIGIYYPYVDEWEDVGPWGALVEHSSDGMLINRPLHYNPSGRRYKYPAHRTYPRIFLNYRRSDSAAYAGRLHERLVTEFGEHDVFMDIFSIQPGEIFSCVVQQAAANCAVMVPVIGRSWAGDPDNRGFRRLSYPNDFVHREIVAAMDREIPLFPVVVPGGAIPTLRDLPEDMRGFEQVQMLTLAPRHWVSDVNDLVQRIKQALSAQQPSDPLYHLRTNPRWRLKKMIDETLTGVGEVFFKKDREAAGKCEYALHRTVSRSLGHTGARIDLEMATAVRAWRDGHGLVLRLEDGRFVDFFVTSIDPNSGTVEVTISGSIPSEW